MDRRQFLAALPAPLAAAAPPRRPNLLFLFSDSHRACSMPGELHCDVEAPNLRRLAEESTSFRNCVSNYPVCSPYRAMLLTGRWPYQTGIIDNSLDLRDNEVSLGRVFRNAGYRTGYIGKWHLNRVEGSLVPEGPRRQGFDDWHVWYKTSEHMDQSFTFDPETGARVQPRGYNGKLMTDTALDFIGRRHSTPWMLMISWNPPHPPYGDAPPEFLKRYDPAALRARPNAKGTGTSGPGRSLQGYYAHISALDAEVGRLMKKLEETGQARETIVVYTSDHGDMIGSHGFGGKRLPFEESCQVPFLVRYPGVVPAGRRNEVLLSTIDIYPTLCSLAGLAVPRHCVGSDLANAARGRQAASPESAFLMHIQKTNSTGKENNPAPLFRGLRTARHTYSVAADGAWCLFDNQEDPYQMHDLLDDARGKRIARDLDGLTMDWLKKAGDPFPFDELRRHKSPRAGRRSPG